MEEFALRIEEESKNAWEMFWSAFCRRQRCCSMWTSDRRLTTGTREMALVLVVAGNKETENRAEIYSGTT
jgi:hypothetical protein